MLEPRLHRGFFSSFGTMKAAGFGKAEKLKSRKQIDALYAGGRSLAVFPLRVKYRFLPGTANVVPIQAGVSVSKRAFKRAVDRNRIKRLLREAYRLQKADLLQTAATQQLQAHIFFMYTDKSLPAFDVIYRAMATCLQQLQQKALRYENPD